MVGDSMVVGQSGFFGGGEGPKVVNFAIKIDLGSEPRANSVHATVPSGVGGRHWSFFGVHRVGRWVRQVGCGWSTESWAAAGACLV